MHVIKHTLLFSSFITQMMSSVGRNTLLSTNPKYAVGIIKVLSEHLSSLFSQSHSKQSSLLFHEDTEMCKGNYIIFTSVLVVLLVGLLCALVAINVDTAGAASNDKPRSEPTAWGKRVEGAMMIAEMLEEFSGDIYFGSEDAGIRFQTAVNSTYYTLKITSIGTGMDVINVIHPQSTNMTMTSIYNVTFMIMMNSTSQMMNDYIVPPNATGLMETMMRSNNPHMTNALFQELDSNNVNIIRQLSLELLASSQEAYIIIESAKRFYEKVRTSSSKEASPDHIKQFWLLGLELEKMRSQLYLLGAPNTASTPTFKHIKCAAGGSQCLAGTKNKCYGNCYKDCSCEEKGFFTWACFRSGYDSFHSDCQFSDSFHDENII